MGGARALNSRSLVPSASYAVAVAIALLAASKSVHGAAASPSRAVLPRGLPPAEEGAASSAEPAELAVLAELAELAERSAASGRLRRNWVATWCSDAAEEEDRGRQALTTLLQEVAPQLVTQDDSAQLENLTWQVPSLRARLEEQSAGRARAAEERLRLQALLEDAGKEVAALTAARDRLQRGASRLRGVASEERVQPQRGAALTTLIEEAVARRGVLLAECGSGGRGGSGEATSEEGEDEELARLRQEYESKATLLAQAHARRQASAAVGRVLRKAASEEKEHSADLQRVCSLASKVFDRLESEAYPLLRQAAEIIEQRAPRDASPTAVPPPPAVVVDDVSAPAAAIVAAAVPIVDVPVAAVAPRAAVPLPAAVAPPAVPPTAVPPAAAVAPPAAVAAVAPLATMAKALVPPTAVAADTLPALAHTAALAQPPSVALAPARTSPAAIVAVVVTPPQDSQPRLAKTSAAAAEPHEETATTAALHAMVEVEAAEKPVPKAASVASESPKASSDAPLVQPQQQTDSVAAVSLPGLPAGGWRSLIKKKHRGGKAGRQAVPAENSLNMYVLQPPATYKAWHPAAASENVPKKNVHNELADAERAFDGPDEGEGEGDGDDAFGAFLQLPEGKRAHTSRVVAAPSFLQRLAITSGVGTNGGTNARSEAAQAVLEEYARAFDSAALLPLAQTVPRLTHADLDKLWKRARTLNAVGASGEQEERRCLDFQRAEAMSSGLSFAMIRDTQVQQTNESVTLRIEFAAGERASELANQSLATLRNLLDRVETDADADAAAVTRLRDGAASRSDGGAAAGALGRAEGLMSAANAEMTDLIGDAVARRAAVAASRRDAATSLRRRLADQAASLAALQRQRRQAAWLRRGEEGEDDEHVRSSYGSLCRWTLQSLQVQRRRGEAEKAAIRAALALLTARRGGAVAEERRSYEEW